MIAFIDALEQTDDDINDHATNVTNGKRVGVWYEYDAQGIILTYSGADDNGLFLYNVPTADEQRVKFRDDAGDIKTRPFLVSMEATVGSVAVADLEAWYHCFFLTGYNTAGAITVQDASAADIKGNVSTDEVGAKILRAFDYDGDTLGGTAGTDKDCVFLCEGDGGATQAKTVFTFTRITTVAFSCEPAQETNV